MPLIVSAEITCHFCSFRNLDLLRKGLYRLEARLLPPKDPAQPELLEDAFTSVIPYSSFAAPRKLSSFALRSGVVTDSSSGSVPGEIIDSAGTYRTRSVHVRYNDEVFDLNEGVTFRLQAPLSAFENDTVRVLLLLQHAEVQLLQTPHAPPLGVSRAEVLPLNGARIGIKQKSRFKSVAPRVLALTGLTMGSVHAMHPTVFDMNHLAGVEVAVHAAVTAVTFKPPPVFSIAASAAAAVGSGLGPSGVAPPTPPQSALQGASVEGSAFTATTSDISTVNPASGAAAAPSKAPSQASKLTSWLRSFGAGGSDSGNGSTSRKPPLVPRSAFQNAASGPTSRSPAGMGPSKRMSADTGTVTNPALREASPWYLDTLWRFLFCNPSPPGVLASCPHLVPGLVRSAEDEVPPGAIHRAHQLMLLPLLRTYTSILVFVSAASVLVEVGREFAAGESSRAASASGEEAAAATGARMPSVGGRDGYRVHPDGVRAQRVPAPRRGGYARVRGNTLGAREGRPEAEEGGPSDDEGAPQSNLPDAVVPVSLLCPFAQLPLELQALVQAAGGEDVVFEHLSVSLPQHLYGAQRTARCSGFADRIKAWSSAAQQEEKHPSGAGSSESPQGGSWDAGEADGDASVSSSSQGGSQGGSPLSSAVRGLRAAARKRRSIPGISVADNVTDAFGVPLDGAVVDGVPVAPFASRCRSHAAGEVAEALQADHQALCTSVFLAWNEVVSMTSEVMDSAAPCLRRAWRTVATAAALRGSVKRAFWVGAVPPPPPVLVPAHISLPSSALPGDAGAPSGGGGGGGGEGIVIENEDAPYGHTPANHIAFSIATEVASALQASSARSQRHARPRAASSVLSVATGDAAAARPPPHAYLSPARAGSSSGSARNVFGGASADGEEGEGGSASSSAAEAPGAAAAASAHRYMPSTGALMQRTYPLHRRVYAPGSAARAMALCPLGMAPELPPGGIRMMLRRLYGAHRMLLQYVAQNKDAYDHSPSLARLAAVAGIAHMSALQLAASDLHKEGSIDGLQLAPGGDGGGEGSNGGTAALQVDTARRGGFASPSDAVQLDSATTLLQAMLFGPGSGRFLERLPGLRNARLGALRSESFKRAQLDIDALSRWAWRLFDAAASTCATGLRALESSVATGRGVRQAALTHPPAPPSTASKVLSVTPVCGGSTSRGLWEVGDATDDGRVTGTQRELDTGVPAAAAARDLWLLQGAKTVWEVDQYAYTSDGLEMVFEADEAEGATAEADVETPPDGDGDGSDAGAAAPARLSAHAAAARSVMHIGMYSEEDDVHRSLFLRSSPAPGGGVGGDSTPGDAPGDALVTHSPLASALVAADSPTLGPFADDAPSVARPVHVVVLQNGMNGTVHDMRLLRAYIKTLYPSCLICSARKNQQGDTEDSLVACGARLAVEVDGFITQKVYLGGCRLGRLSFVGYSLGGLIIRLALRHPLVHQHAAKLHALVTIATPHLGLAHGTSPLFDTGVFFIRKWRRSAALEQLSMRDEQHRAACLLHLLSSGWSSSTSEEDASRDDLINMLTGSGGASAGPVATAVSAAARRSAAAARRAGAISAGLAMFACQSAPHLQRHTGRVVRAGRPSAQAPPAAGAEVAPPAAASEAEVAEGVLEALQAAAEEDASPAVQDATDISEAREQGASGAEQSAPPAAQEGDAEPADSAAAAAPDSVPVSVAAEDIPDSAAASRPATPPAEAPSGAAAGAGAAAPPPLAPRAASSSHSTHGLRSLPTRQESALYSSSTYAELAEAGMWGGPEGAMLRHFRHIVLAGSPQDKYIPFHSCRCELYEGAEEEDGAWRDLSRQLEGIWEGVDMRRVVRLGATFHLASKGLSMDSMIGREAHIAFLESRSTAAWLAFFLAPVLETTVPARARRRSELQGAHEPLASKLPPVSAILAGPDTDTESLVDSVAARSNCQVLPGMLPHLDFVPVHLRVIGGGFDEGVVDWPHVARMHPHVV